MQPETPAVARRYRSLWTLMAEERAPGDEAARLEAALDRIWQAGALRPSAAHAQGTTELATRLDALIAEIRAALGKDSAD